MLICPPYNSSTIFVNFIEFYVSDKIDLNYKFIYFPQKKKKSKKSKKKKENLNLIQTKRSINKTCIIPTFKVILFITMTVHYYTIIMFTVLVLLVYTCVIYVPQSINQLPLPFFSINQSSPYNPIFMIYVHYIILNFNPFILEPCHAPMLNIIIKIPQFY